VSRAGDRATGRVITMGALMLALVLLALVVLVS
jgi:hypothetical protein